MVTRTDYSEAEVQACSSVLLEIATMLGEFLEHIVVVGGNVPRLLISTSVEKHSGTLDVDLALDFERIGDDTYRTILQTLQQGGYYQKPDDQPFRFYRDVKGTSNRQITVGVDLLAGEYGGTGRGRRHQKVQDAKARKARGCDLVFENCVRVVLEGRLPDGARNKVCVKVAGIGPFLVMKGMALWKRMNQKDAYDIYYCCKNYPGKLPSLVKAVKPILSGKLAREGLGRIRAKFMAVDGIGPTWVADFLEVSDMEERGRTQREAFELVSRLMKKLRIEPYLE